MTPTFKQNLIIGLRKFLLLSLVIIVPYCLYLLYITVTSEPPTPPSVISYGLEVGNTGDTTLYGALYFTADVREEGDQLYFPKIYSHSFAEDFSTQYNAAVARSYARKDEFTDLLVAHVTDSDDPDGIDVLAFDKGTSEFAYVAAVGGYNEVELTVSPAGNHYAYGFQSEAGTDELDIGNWNIALHSFGEGEVITLQAASQPVFTENGEDLLYMKKDGIYRYNIDAGESYPFSMLYYDFSRADNFTYNSNGSTLIITSPNLHLISVQNVDFESGAVERGAIVTSDTRYKYPVISPDSRFYAVMAAKDGDFDAESNTYSKIDAEIRLIDDADFLERVTFDNFVPSTVILQQWLTN